MNYQDSKSFYKDQWHRPFGRVRKTVLPILVSMIAILLIGGVSIVFISYFGDSHYLYNSDFLQLLRAVFGGTSVSLIAHYFRLYKSSQFQLIKVRLNSQEKYRD
jgi:hypothetical protein